MAAAEIEVAITSILPNSRRRLLGSGINIKYVVSIEARVPAPFSIFGGQLWV